MATAITTAGKYQLFKQGWSGIANKIKLYTNLGVLVDTQSVTFTWNSTNKTIEPNADVVFDVSAGVNDVAYIELIYDDTSTDTVLYTKDLSSLYDFPTSGTLTIENWAIGVSSSEFTDDGKNALLTDGLEPEISKASLILGNTSVTVNASFTANSSSGRLNADSTIIFNVPGGTTGISQFTLSSYTSTPLPLETPLFVKTFNTTYDFTNKGTLSISSFYLQVS